MLVPKASVAQSDHLLSNPDKFLLIIKNIKPTLEVLNRD